MRLSALEKVVKLSARDGKLDYKTEGTYKSTLPIEAITVMGIKGYSGKTHVRGLDGNAKVDSAWMEDMETLRMTGLEIRFEYEEDRLLAW